MAGLSINRRKFLIAASATGGGMVLALVGCKMSKDIDGTGMTSVVPWGPDAAQGNEFTPWLEISADSTVTLRVPNQEIGNGTMTQMAMNVAEELGCAWSDIRAVLASIRRDYVEDHVYTKAFLPFFGGHATNKERMAFTMQLGASARERLKAAAAARWGVPASEISVSQSVLTHRPSGRTLSFGDVAAEAGMIELKAEPALKPEREWTLIGKKSPAKLNIPDIATGRAIYGIDIKIPGMVHAALKQAPVQGGRLKSHKPEAVLSMPGVRAVVVVDPAKSKKSPVEPQTNFGISETTAQHAVAVIADHFWQAKTALEALPVEWDLGPGASAATSEAIYEAMRGKRDGEPGKSLLNTGNVASAKGRKVVEAEYRTPYCENAVMEPLGGTALVTADGVEVWCSTQDSRQAFWTAVDETGMTPEKVTVHPTYVGGGFGRRTQSDDIRMVVAIAREFPGVPVKTIWTREEMFRQGRYRTPIATRFSAVLDDSTGLPKAVSGHANFSGDRPLFHLTQGFLDPPYFNSGAIPNVSLAQSNLPVHVLNGAYRGPCFNSHAFITETFIDECAHAAGIDPLEYRLRLLANWSKSWRDCLNLAARKIGWGRTLPKGEGIGIAITAWPTAMKDAGSVVATAAHIAVTPEGQLNVRQVDVAFDCGRVANADAVRAQVEGGTIFGLNMTLNEEMTIKDGAMVEGNFDVYPMLHMADIPKINVHFDALSGHDRFEIMGEVPAGPIGPAVGNAIFSAIGKRLRSTPFRKHDLSWT
jgi:isoquinoline 1-oxidoreductase subunit beta